MQSETVQHTIDPMQVASLMDKYAEYLDDADDDSGESTKMMREAMAHTQVCGVFFFVYFCGVVGAVGAVWLG